jgi:glutaredoxin 3
MPDIMIYATEWCGWCQRAKALLRAHGVRSWTEIDVEALPGRWDELTERTGGKTVPQIYIGGEHIGGYDDLAALAAGGRLQTLLEG